MSKILVTTVVDESQQSFNIIDIPGYSHMSQPYQIYRAGQNITVRDVFFPGRTNKQELQLEINFALGASKWPNLNKVREYNPVMKH